MLVEMCLNSHSDMMTADMISFLGYALDQSRSNCTDIDECANPESCKFGECVNKLGSFECNCPPGFELLASGNACIGEYI